MRDQAVVERKEAEKRTRLSGIKTRHCCRVSVRVNGETDQPPRIAVLAERLNGVRAVHRLAPDAVEREMGIAGRCRERVEPQQREQRNLLRRQDVEPALAVFERRRGVTSRLTTIRADRDGVLGRVEDWRG